VFVDGFLSVELLPYCVVVHEVPLAAPLNLEASPCIRRKLEGALRVARAALLPVLEASYGSFHDWIACFVISGILGELYRDERAFGAPCRPSELSQGDASIVRSTWL